MTPVRFPAARRLATEIAASKPPRQTVGQAAAYLMAHQAELRRIGSHEDLGILADQVPVDPMVRALEINFNFVRNALLDQLWRRQIFIGFTVLDELLYESICSPQASDPILELLEFLRERRAARPGLVVFPLHSLGIMGAGLLRGDTKEKAQLINPRWGLAVSPQTNSLDQTAEFLERSRTALGVRKQIDFRQLFELHRYARWLESNPLLVIRLTTHPGHYFDAHRAVMSRVRAACAQLAMAASFQPASQGGAGVLLSSSQTNNFETLDIKHYLVFSNNPGIRQRLDGRSFATHRRQTNVLELSDLSIELDPSFVGRRKTMEDIDRAVGSVYQGHLDFMWARRPTSPARTNDRWHAALLDEDLLYFTPSNPADLALAGQQQGTEKISAGSERGTARVLHVRAWFDDISSGTPLMKSGARFAAGESSRP